MTVQPYWPDITPRPKHQNPCEGWVDPELPDFRKIWKIARACGYAVGLHGSMVRDVDLIAVAWTESAFGSGVLVDAVCKGLNARVIGSEVKPRGRVAHSIQIDGYFKVIDLSIVEGLVSE